MGDQVSEARVVAKSDPGRLTYISRLHVSLTVRFCSSAGNEFFCEVPRDYMLDDFNWLNMTCDREALNTLVLARTATGSASSSTSAGASGMGSAARRSLHKQAQHMYVRTEGVSSGNILGACLTLGSVWQVWLDTR